MLPCAGKRPKLTLHHRVRLEINDGPNVLIYATDGYSAALAIVSVWEDRHRDPIIFDLSPAQVRATLEIFEAPADKAADDEPDAILQIEVLDNAFEITDVSGLPGIDGRHYGDPRIDVPADYPDVPHMLARLRASQIMVGDDPIDMVFSRIADFRAATSAYSDSLRITPYLGTRSYGIEVGESFIGMVRAFNVNEDTRARRAEWQQDWNNRLPDPESTPRNATPADTKEQTR
ncbi:hypothetical protein F8M49_20925 [Rhodococcus zopfii]|uniref:Uncharacterized protein n=1 Tax=Rhodococcus zopfii TaxID=43772 RepID=A0ABU3WT70_9NOCA|nr:hypothetical protein [Rhodococcus zopfii]